PEILDRINVALNLSPRTLYHVWDVGGAPWRFKNLVYTNIHENIWVPKFGIVSQHISPDFKTTVKGGGLG
ncbi:MAG: hypothetical protein QW514_10225, partial [Thermoprotei archaeon]